MNREDKKEEIYNLTELLCKYSRQYYRDGRPEVSDSEYDRLYERLLRLEKENPELRLSYSPTNRVMDGEVAEGEEVEHSILVLSLDKAYSLGEIGDFIRRVKKISDKNNEISVEEKIDGLSAVIYYRNGVFYKAVSRGNGRVGSDISASVKTIKSVPLKLSVNIDIAVRGEIYLDHESFKKINSTLEEPYSNARNLAAGLIKRQNMNQVAGTGLNVFIYEGFSDDLKCDNHKDMLKNLYDLGFRINPHIDFINQDDEEKLRQIIERKTNERKTLDYDIDGLVIKVNDFSIREELGYTEHHPRWAIAYKFESPLAQSVIQKIEIQVGRTGRITPVAFFNKTFLLGSYIESASLHNRDYIEGLEIAIGDLVSFSKRGDVIPQIENVVEKNEIGNTTFKFPTHCPVCNSVLSDVGRNVYCLNQFCNARLIAEAIFFASKDAMDIDGIGQQTVRDLFELGLMKDYTDLYFIDYDKDLYGKRDYKEKKIKIIKDGLEKSKKKPFSSTLVALQIPELGKRTAEMLIENGLDSVEKFISMTKDANFDTIKNISGIGEKIINNIKSCFTNETFLKRLSRLREAGLKFEKDEEDSFMISNELAGQVWCVTGSIAGYKNPEAALDEVKKRGARIVSGVSSKTTHLLVGSKPGSKLEKAIANNKTIIVNEKDYPLYWQGGKKE